MVEPLPEKPHRVIAQLTAAVVNLAKHFQHFLGLGHGQICCVFGLSKLRDEVFLEAHLIYITFACSLVSFFVQSLLASEVFLGILEGLLKIRLGDWSGIV